MTENFNCELCGEELDEDNYCPVCDSDDLDDLLFDDDDDDELDDDYDDDDEELVDYDEDEDKD